MPRTTGEDTTCDPPRERGRRFAAIIGAGNRTFARKENKRKEKVTDTLAPPPQGGGGRGRGWEEEALRASEICAADFACRGPQLSSGGRESSGEKKSPRRLARGRRIRRRERNGRRGDRPVRARWGLSIHGGGVTGEREREDGGGERGYSRGREEEPGLVAEVWL